MLCNAYNKTSLFLCSIDPTLSRMLHGSFWSVLALSLHTVRAFVNAIDKSDALFGTLLMSSSFVVLTLISRVQLISCFAV